MCDVRGLDCSCMLECSYVAAYSIAAYSIQLYMRPFSKAETRIGKLVML
jgi:hypothetical protein